MIQTIKRYWSIVCLSLLTLSGCKIYESRSLDVDLMIEWNKAALENEIYTEGIAVPVAARYFGYHGVIPVIVDAYCQNNFTFIKQYLPELKLPEYQGGPINRTAALNIAYYEFSSKYFVNQHYKNKETCTRIFTKWDKKLNNGSNKTDESKKIGLQIARAILDWANEDSIASLAYLHNFDRNYMPVKEPGKWEVDPENPMPALLPNWGDVKPILFHYREFKCIPPKAYSTDKYSPYYIEALELFTISSPLSFENKWIAEFWGDDIRGLTVTPAGRWVAILNQIAELENPSFETTRDAYFKLGVALCDAAILTWKNKYIFNTERPESYIRKNIQDAWRPFHHSPNFPGYPSGHSVFGGAASEVLTHIFGDNYAFTDKTHEGRKEFLSEPRHFNSIKEMSIENAYSRIALGVHFRMDCAEGLRLGTEIGKKLNKIDLGIGKEISKN